MINWYGIPYRFGEYWRIDIKDEHGKRYIEFESQEEAWNWFYNDKKQIVNT